MDYFQYIQAHLLYWDIYLQRFKPYYKWITFNIIILVNLTSSFVRVLNLIINGLLSILQIENSLEYYMLSFKPYYKWITFNILH